MLQFFYLLPVTVLVVFAFVQLRSLKETQNVFKAHLSNFQLPCLHPLPLPLIPIVNGVHKSLWQYLL